MKYSHGSGSYHSYIRHSTTVLDTTNCIKDSNPYHKRDNYQRNVGTYHTHNVTTPHKSVGAHSSKADERNILADDATRAWDQS